MLIINERSNLKKKLASASNISNEEAPGPSAAVLQIFSEDEEAGVNRNQELASTAPTKRLKKDGLTKYEDEYTVGKRHVALSAKANKGEFAELHAVTPAVVPAEPARSPARISCIVFFS
jgi:hypothetical protein